MRCPKVIRWLCGNRAQKRSVRRTIHHLNEQRAASLTETKRLKRESIQSVLFPEQSSGESPP